MNLFQEFWNVVHGAVHGALGALFGERVEVEKRDASEDETISAREEVANEFYLFLDDTEIMLFLKKNISVVVVCTFI